MSARRTRTWRRRLWLALACEYWPDWDNVFRKRYWGWMQGDAGSTVVIGNQLLWSLVIRFRTGTARVPSTVPLRKTRATSWASLATSSRCIRCRAPRTKRPRWATETSRGEATPETSPTTGETSRARHAPVAHGRLQRSILAPPHAIRKTIRIRALSQTSLISTTRRTARGRRAGRTLRMTVTLKTASRVCARSSFRSSTSARGACRRARAHARDSNHVAHSVPRSHGACRSVHKRRRGSHHRLRRW